MKTWNQLFIRYGWKLNQKERNVFDCRLETKKNIDFLLNSLDQADVSYNLENQILSLQSEPVSEQKWVEILDFPLRGRGEGLGFRPGEEEAKVIELDTYIAGIVRQLNRLGFHTSGSCDGHERRPAHVYVMVTKERDSKQLVQMLLALGLKRVNCREHSSSCYITLHLQRNKLLDLAEKMSFIKESWIEQGFDYIKKQMFYVLLEQLLSIPGVSGKEDKIREYVKGKLSPYVDYLSIDRHGNLLAEKTYKSGNGPTILLNAHLDTVCEIESDRVIKKENNIWSSSKGILGGDDRAGVAVLLFIAEHLSNSSFNGKVKFIFTVEEESGLVGANHLDDYFLWGTDAAIVVDRRGKGDIVTSCGGYIPFCDEVYGEFFETIAEKEGLSGWSCTNGGSSDTRIWAEHGIQCVNLSAGYRNEHTDNEYLDVEAAYETVSLIKGIFNNTKELRHVLRTIKRNKDIEQITG
ncbi:M20/M25/M40 family metallo-hydrolase [Virgibacillus doumboii]|uniref:M20/M25/M40 family metallo-hydrolase n=1 Tax=Virgibacillus doumboii TaxID=2697503 RepID=UPI0013DF7C04|nr:M20/M25/M40 family metallo-hydrolase [Virgibacillus doumboii]